MDSILKNLKYFRNLKGYSQAEMGDLLELTRSTYSKMECGVVEISTTRLFKIAEVLGVKPEDFFAKDPTLLSSNKHTTEEIAKRIKVLMDLCMKNDELIKSLQETISLLKERVETLKEKSTSGISKSKKKR